MKKYVVYLTIYSGDKLPPYYIGSTSEKKVLSCNYFGSITSKKWGNIFRGEIKNNKYLFSIKILSKHNTRSEALEEELRIQIKNDVVKSPLYYNESLASINGMCGMDVSGRNNPMFGKLRTKKFKKLISSNMKKYWENSLNRIKQSEIKINFLKDPKNNSMFGKTGKNNPQSRIVFQIDKNSGKLIKEWDSVASVYRELKISEQNISKVCLGKLKSSGGFIWKYKNIDNV